MDKAKVKEIRRRAMLELNYYEQIEKEMMICPKSKLDTLQQEYNKHKAIFRKLINSISSSEVFYEKKGNIPFNLCINLYNKGYNANQIAKECNITLGEAKYVIKKIENDYKRKNYSQAEILVIKQMLKKGKSAREIAPVIKRKYNSVVQKIASMKRKGELGNE